HNKNAGLTSNSEKVPGGGPQQRQQHEQHYGAQKILRGPIDRRIVNDQEGGFKKQKSQDRLRKGEDESGAHDNICDDSQMDQANFQAPSSRTFSPKSPFGRRMRIRMRTTKAKTSLYSAPNAPSVRIERKSVV